MLRPRIFGCLWIVCLLSLEIQGQCTKPVLSDNVVSNSSDTNFSEGSSLRLTCILGYQPASGKRTVTCQDRQWVPLPLDFTCEKKPCENPGNVINGKYDIPEGIDFGAVITAVCNEGHYLVGQGSGTRTCLADGKWTGQEPFCEVVKCNSPPPIENGQIVNPKDGYQYDDVVVYACKDDYTMNGNRESRCTVSSGSQKGTWTVQPTCKMVECQKPVIPNATPTGSGGSGPYKYKAVLMYKCNEGFHMVSGEARIVCQKSGNWSSIPECKVFTPVVECPEPIKTNTIIVNGEGGPYRPGHVIQYQCLHHLQLHGESHLKCGPHGQWSAKPPVCEEKHPRTSDGVNVAAAVCGVLVVVAVCGVLGYYFYKRSKHGKNSTGNNGLEPTPSPDTDTVLTPLKENISPSASSEPDPV